MVIEKHIVLMCFFLENEQKKKQAYNLLKQAFHFSHISCMA